MANIRREQIQDIPAIYRVNSLAFESQVEAEIVNKLRSRGVVTLSLVAELEGEVVELAEGAARSTFRWGWFITSLRSSGKNDILSKNYKNPPCRSTFRLGFSVVYYRSKNDPIKTGLRGFGIGSSGLFSA